MILGRKEMELAQCTTAWGQRRGGPSWAEKALGRTWTWVLRLQSQYAWSLWILFLLYRKITYRQGQRTFVRWTLLGWAGCKGNSTSPPGRPKEVFVLSFQLFQQSGPGSVGKTQDSRSEGRGLTVLSKLTHDYRDLYKMGLCPFIALVCVHNEFSQHSKKRTEW